MRDGDRSIGQGRVGRTQPLPFASDEPFEIGSDCGSPMTRDYAVHAFTGTVSWVEIEIPEDSPDFDSEISAEQRLNVALARE